MTNKQIGTSQGTLYSSSGLSTTRCTTKALASRRDKWQRCPSFTSGLSSLPDSSSSWPSVCTLPGIAIPSQPTTRPYPSQFLSPITMEMLIKLRSRQKQEEEARTYIFRTFARAQKEQNERINKLQLIYIQNQESHCFSCRKSAKSGKWNSKKFGSSWQSKTQTRGKSKLPCRKSEKPFCISPACAAPTAIARN